MGIQATILLGEVSLHLLAKIAQEFMRAASVGANAQLLGCEQHPQFVDHLTQFRMGAAIAVYG